MYHYALTLVKNTNPVWITDYVEFIEKFGRDYPKADLQYYYEATHGLHIHAYVCSPTRIYINKIHPGKGWKLDFHPVKNVLHWQNYIKKGGS